jgi:hypothetical protein
MRYLDQGKLGRWKLLPLGAVAGLLLLAWLCQARPRTGYYTVPETPLQTVTTGPFVFTSDLPPEVVRSCASELLTLEQHITAELKLPRLSVPIRLYLFQERTRYLRFLEEYFPSLREAAASRRAMFLLRANRPFVFAYRTGDFRRDLRHEFAHALLGTSVTNLPLWLDEGLAVFFESPDGTQPAHLAFISNLLRDGEIPNLAQLEAATDFQRLGSREYALAWSWVHLLLRGPNEAREVLRQYLVDLQKGDAKKPLTERLERRFPDLYGNWIDHLEGLQARKR